jgi:type IX secretion system PorP/SprF family membrane protein
MKRILLIAAFILGVWSITSAQQLPLYSQYMLNSFLINPAIAGSSDFVPVIMTARSQWVGIKNAPETQAISGHTSLGNAGVGGYLFNDNYGPLRSTGVQGSYSYHLPLNKFGTKLSFGLSLSAFQYKLNKDDLVVLDEDDMVVNQSREKVMIPDANFGAYLYSKQYFVGLSGAQLFQYKIKFVEGSDNYSQVTRHYFVTAGYRFIIQDQWMIEPSILYKKTEATPYQIDYNARLYYKTNLWFGLSYRTGDAVVSMVGVNYKRYFFGYAYDFTLSDIMNYSHGSHEVMIGIDLGDPNKVIKSPRYL